MSRALFISIVIFTLLVVGAAAAWLIWGRSAGDLDIAVNNNLPAMNDFQSGTDDWPWWRGPNRDGLAGSQPGPLHWSETENIRWKTALPGRGYSSPIVLGQRLFVTTDRFPATTKMACISIVLRTLMNNPG